MERSIVKAWRVVEHVVRENNSADREGLSCWTEGWSRAEILDDALHNRAPTRHISAPKLYKVRDKDNQRDEKENRAQQNPEESHYPINLPASAEPEEKQSDDNKRRRMQHADPREGPQSQFEDRLVGCLCHSAATPVNTGPANSNRDEVPSIGSKYAWGRPRAKLNLRNQAVT